VGVASGVSLLGLALLIAQAPPPAKKAPAPAAGGTVTFDAVRGGKLPAGRNVEFPAILLPPTVVQTQSAGKTRYFVLAVKKDSSYMQSVAEGVKLLREQGFAKVKEAATVLADDEGFRRLSNELDQLLKTATGEKIGRTSAVPPEEAIVVEVSGMDAVATAYKWETIFDKQSPITPSQLSVPPPVFPSAQGYPGFAEDSVRRELVNLSHTRPPDLSRRLPDFGSQRQFEDERTLESYNAAVELFNVELQRRRQHAVSLTEQDLQLAIERLEHVLALEEQPLSATVIAKADIAAETYSRIHGRAPTAYVRERARPEATFAKRYFAKSHLLITSYPNGAAITLDGRELGTAPCIARDLAVGKAVKLVASKPGHKPREWSEKITAQPSGVLQVELVLELEGVSAPRPMTDAEGRQLFSAGFKPAKPFGLAAHTPSETPGFKGKKDKDGTKRMEALRKAVASGSTAGYAGWFQLAPPDVAEVELEVALPEGERNEKGEKRKKDDRVFKFTYRGDQGEDAVSEVLGLDSRPAGVERLLYRMSEQLKQRFWQRALGVQ